MSSWRQAIYSAKAPCDVLRRATALCPRPAVCPSYAVAGGNLCEDGEVCLQVLNLYGYPLSHEDARSLTDGLLELARERDVAGGSKLAMIGRITPVSCRRKVSSRVPTVGSLEICSGWSSQHKFMWAIMVPTSPFSRPNLTICCT